MSDTVDQLKDALNKLDAKKERRDEMRAWDRYAAAALAGDNGMNEPTEAAMASADYADAILAERKKRWQDATREVVE